MTSNPLQIWYYSTIIALSILTPFLVSSVMHFYSGKAFGLFFLGLMLVMAVVRMLFTTLWISTSKATRVWVVLWSLLLMGYLYVGGSLIAALTFLVVAGLAGNVTFFGPGRRNTILTLSLISAAATAWVFSRFQIFFTCAFYCFTISYVATCELNKDAQDRLLHQQSRGPFTISLLSYGLKKLLAVGFSLKRDNHEK